MTTAEPQTAPPLDALRPGRVHEATGPGRRAFALLVAGALEGPVLWVQEAREGEVLYAPGLGPFFDPARLVLLRPAGPLALLQVMEEALRAGPAPLVVAELDGAPDLTASRRLQLAAGTGGGRGICLVPEGRLATNAAETRWRCLPQPGRVAGPPRLHAEMVKNKRGPLGVWDLAVAPRKALAAGGAAPAHA